MVSRAYRPQAVHGNQPSGRSAFDITAGVTTHLAGGYKPRANNNLGRRRASAVSPMPNMRAV